MAQIKHIFEISVQNCIRNNQNQKIEFFKLSTPLWQAGSSLEKTALKIFRAERAIFDVFQAVFAIFKPNFAFSLQKSDFFGEFLEIFGQVPDPIGGTPKNFGGGKCPLGLTGGKCPCAPFWPAPGSRSHHY